MTVRRSLLAPVAFLMLVTCASDESSTPVSAEVCSSELNSGVVETALTAGGATHRVRIFIPSVADGSARLPTVLNWHGNGWTGEDHASYTDYEALAEQEGFIVVHPTGTMLPDLPILSQGLAWEVVDGLDSPAVDDIAFANALIDELVVNWCADSNRIFSIGLSNGSVFTSTLVCAIADRLAGAASVAGIFHSPTCTPSEPVPYIAFHGVDDPAVPYRTDDPTIFSELRPTILALGAFEAFAAFAADFGCDPEPTVSEVTENVTRFDYANCPADTPMTFYAFGGAADGHSWPGAPGDSNTTHDIDATLESWRFFEPLSK